MKTDNELIAEFMGWRCWNENNKLQWYEGSYLAFEKNPTLSKEQYYSQFIWSPWAKDHQPTKIDSLKYHTSWDWLMPVVEKITMLNPKSGKIHFWYVISHCHCRIWANGPFGVEWEFATNAGSTIEAVYKAVVEFIHWHNDQIK